MGKCIIFIRVSTESQEFISQREELYRTAHNHGYADQDIIEISKKESGKKLSESEREGLTELYQYFEKGGVSDVYIWELSRLSRRQKDIFAIIEKFKDYRVQLHCLNPSFVLLNREKTDIELSARLAIGIFGAMAEQEVIEKKARFARGKKIKAEQNKYNGGAIPYGYRVDKEQDNLIVPDEVESEVVREIFRLYEKGYSQAKIARELDSRGAKGRSVRTTVRFTISLVHQILTNELLTGKPLLNRGASYVRSYPPIISEEQFKRCREIAAKNNKVVPKSKRVFYAHGLLKCPVCGRNYVSSGYKGYYKCGDAYNTQKAFNGYLNPERCSNRLVISTNILDSLLWHIAVERESAYIMGMDNEQMQEYKKSKEIINSKIRTIPKRKEKLSAEQNRITHTYIKGAITTEEYDELLHRIKHQAIDLDKELAQYENELIHIEELIETYKERKKQNRKFSEDLDRLDIEIRGITDDDARRNIIKKHIKKVEIFELKIPYIFKNTGEIEVNAKRIVVDTYALHNKIEYIFIPNDGKGGTFLRTQRWHETIYYVTERIQYLDRIKGHSNEEKIERQIAQAIEDGYITMRDLSIKHRISFSNINSVIRFAEEKREITRRIRQVWYVNEEWFLHYYEKVKEQAEKAFAKIEGLTKKY